MSDRSRPHAPGHAVTLPPQLARQELFEGPGVDRFDEMEIEARVLRAAAVFILPQPVQATIVGRIPPGSSRIIRQTS